MPRAGSIILPSACWMFERYRLGLNFEIAAVPRLLPGPHDVRAHHFIVFVLQNMAVPHVQPR